MPEGDVSVTGYDLTQQGDFFPHRSRGTHSIQRELMALPALWVAPAPMLQVAPGHKWCACCGEVRPLSYFDPLTFDDDGTPVTYAKECKQCINARDPKLATEKFCSACKTMHPRDDFADDADYADGKYPSCAESERKRRTANYARDVWLNEGREVRRYDQRVPRGRALRRA